MFIGIDIGTSAVKFVLVDADQHLLATLERPLAPVQPRPLWSEDDPEKWWQAVAGGLDALARDHPKSMSAVDGIGLSGQMHSAVLLDATDEPVRPAILWNDGRSTAEAAELAQLGVDLQCETGVLPMPGFTGPKFLWLKRNEPETVRRTRTLLLAKDFIRLKLSGEKATDVTDAAGAWLLDEARRQWSDRALAACGIDRSLLPQLMESRDASATVRPELAARWGFRRNVVIAAGAGRCRGGRHRCRHRQSGRWLHLARHLGADLPRRHGASSRSRPSRACLLPCAARSLVPDGGLAEWRQSARGLCPLVRRLAMSLLCSPRRRRISRARLIS